MILPAPDPEITDTDRLEALATNMGETNDNAFTDAMERFAQQTRLDDLAELPSEQRADALRACIDYAIKETML